MTAEKSHRQMQDEWATAYIARHRGKRPTAHPQPDNTSTQPKEE